MSRQTEKSEASRQRIVDVAGEAFRKNGYSGIGVDGLAKGAGLTSGAFYFHFKSKLDAFAGSLKSSLENLRASIEEIQATQGKSWLASFAAFYLGFKRTCDLSEGCSLPALTPEVERAGEQAREAYEKKLREIAAIVASGLPANRTMSRRDRAWIVLALLSGGVNMARAVKDKELSEEIAAAVEKGALFIGK